jgi:PAS domain S-box-containing protein
MADCASEGPEVREGELFRLLARNARGHAVFMTDPEGRVLTWGPGAEALLGYPAADVLGRPADLFFTPEDRDAGAPARLLAEARANGSAVDDRWLLRRGGARFWSNGSVTPLLDEKGTLRGFARILRDGTARKLAEERLAAVIDHSPSCIFAKDRAGRYVLANRALARLVGREPADLLGKTDADAFGPEIAAQFAADDRAVLTTGQARTFEETFPHGNGTVTAVTVKFPLLDAAGRPTAVCGIATDVTEHRRAEEALRAGEERLRLALEAGRMGVWDWDLATGKISWSENLEPIHGLATGAFGGTRDAFRALVHPDDLPQLEAAIARALEERGEFDVEFRNLRPDGTTGWMAGKGRVFTDPSGKPARVIGVGTDVTVRKQAERALRQSEARFAGLVNHAPAAIFIKDREGHYLLVNRLFEELAGLPTQRILCRIDADLFDPETAARFRAQDLGVLAADRPEMFEETFPYAGRDFTFLTTKFPLRDETGAANAVCGIAIDVSDRKRAEDAQRQSEEQFRRAVTEAPIPVLMHAEGGEVLAVSNALLRLSGYTREELRTLDDWLRLAHGSAAGPVAAGGRGPNDRAGGTAEEEFVIRTRAGEARVWNFTASAPGRLRDGRKFLVAMATDVTDRRRAERDSSFLAEASATLAALVDDRSTLQKVAGLAVPFFADWCAVDMLAGDGTLRRLAVAHIDPAKVELAHELSRRMPPDPNAATGVWAVIRSGKPELVPEITDAMLAEGVRDPELLAIFRELGLKSYMAVPLVARGKVLGAVTFISAETGRRYGPADLAVAEDLAHRAAVALENARLYNEVREADRRKDEFLATLAHELRNPLAPIRNGLEVLKSPGADAVTAAAVRAVMERQLQHLVRLVDDLLDVSRVMRGKVELRKARVDLADVVARAVETARPALDARRHDFAVEGPGEPLILDADPVRLAQVIGNLLTNAAKYTDPGGRVRLSVRREGGAAVLRVRDDGIGIPPEILPQVFELFVQADHATTRAQGGLGIGLTLVKSLVEMHGGSVAAHSDGPGKGSEFTVRLPLAAGAVPEAAAGVRNGSAAIPAAGTRAARRVLVVDDNVDAAESLALVLRLGGHAVRVAHNGPRALELAGAERPEIVFLDIGMPGMDGYEVARRLRASGAAGTVLVALTGWGTPEDRRRSAAAGFDHHLVKPVEIDEVQRLLAAPVKG